MTKVPTVPEELHESEWTRKRKHRIDLHEHRGSTVYFAIRYENSKGEHGPWGPMFSAIVP